MRGAYNWIRMPLGIALLSLACLTPLWMTSCEAPAVPSACGHISRMVPDPGFETRWTRSEKIQAVDLNRALERDCGNTGRNG